jgi:hypothetical protein
LNALKFANTYWPEQQKHLKPWGMVAFWRRKTTLIFHVEGIFQGAQQFSKPVRELAFTSSKGLLHSSWRKGVRETLSIAHLLPWWAKASYSERQWDLQVQKIKEKVMLMITAIQAGNVSRGLAVCSPLYEAFICLRNFSPHRLFGRSGSFPIYRKGSRDLKTLSERGPV